MRRIKQIFNRNIIFILLFLFTSCSSSRMVNLNPGVFESKFQTEVPAILTLNKDKTFTFVTNGHMIYTESKGTWQMNGDIITINSYENYKSGYISKVEESKISGTGRIQVVDGNGAPLFFAGVILDNNQEIIVLDSLGKAKITQKPFKLVTILYHDDIKFRFEKKDSLSNNLKVIVATDEGYKEYFEDHKFKLSRKGLASLSEHPTIKIGEFYQKVIK